jgi:hypothetical protein
VIVGAQGMSQHFGARRDRGFWRCSQPRTGIDLDREQRHRLPGRGRTDR